LVQPRRVTAALTWPGPSRGNRSIHRVVDVAELESVPRALDVRRAARDV